MNKVTRFLKEHKTFTVASGVILIVTTTFALGRIYEGRKIESALDYMALSGKTMSKMIDESKYVCLVTKVK